MNTILIIANTYPSAVSPHQGTFVRNLAKGWSQMGYHVKVIAPKPLPMSFVELARIFKKVRELDPSIEVVRPLYLNISFLLTFLPASRRSLRDQLFSFACRASSERHRNVSFVYAHFLATSPGAEKAAKALGVPSYIGCGESDIQSGYQRLSEKSKTFLKVKCNGIICNSPVILEYLRKTINCKDQQLTVIPNIPDPAIFQPRDLIKARRSLGFQSETLILIFVGQFITRKGFKIVEECLKIRPKWNAIFIGKGVGPKVNGQIIFSGSTSHENIPPMMACANVFVLPTLAEGCCNAIAEAMAMGLPVISSRIPEVECQINSDSTILIDPTSVEELAAALDIIEKNYAEFKQNAIKYASDLNGTTRAQKIVEWIDRKI